MHTTVQNWKQYNILAVSVLQNNKLDKTYFVKHTRRRWNMDFTLQSFRNKYP